ncbi:MAG: FG-GAP-like repeat-containing protein [Janthinobacterium lividum]
MMKHYSFLWSGGRIRVLALAFLLGSGSLAASGQALNYAPAGATVVAGTYTDLGTTGSVIATSNTDNANSAAQNIGFSFAYNGSVFTQFVLNTNGAVRLGSTAPAAALYYDNNPASTTNTDPLLSTTAANSNLLLPFNFDLVSGTGGAEYRVATTTGAVGSRVCTIQWKNVSDKTGAGVDAANVTQFANFSFQLKLYETSNRIEFVYGPVTASTGALGRRYISAGLKGSGLNQGQVLLATKLISSPWSTTLFQDAIYTGSYYSISNQTLPVRGSTYRFEPVAATAIITGISPSSGPVGTSLTITGTNLTGSSLVSFSGTSRNTVSTGLVVNAAGTQLTGVTVPAGAQSGAVSVQTAVGPVVNPTYFTVIPTAPVITSFAPSSALPGEPVTITGVSFTGATALTLNGNAVANFTVVDATTLTFTVPTNAMSGVLAVTTPVGKGSSKTPLTVLSAGPPLLITAVVPAANAQVVARATPFSITFDQPLVAASAAALQVYSAQRGGRLTLANPATMSGNTLRFAPPAAGFLPGEKVTSVVTTATKGTTGVLLANPYVSQFTIATAPGTGTFAAKTDYATGEGPYKVALGDMNGDGLLDMVTANYTAYTISVRLGQAGGTFAATKTDYPVGGFGSCVALGDINGDGRLDVVVGLRYGYAIAVLLAKADGGYSYETYAATTRSPYAVAVGDVNGDGLLDIVAADISDWFALVLLGKAGGGFADAARYPIGADPQCVALGDLDGDGLLDIVSADSYSGYVTVLRGLAYGGFAPRASYEAGYGTAGVALGDVDGDGRLDIVTSNYGLNTASVLLGQSGGGFARKVDYATGTGANDVALGDVNGDGRPDIVTANYGAGTVSVLLGQAGGIFAPKVDYATGKKTYGVTLGDVDGDGRLDIVAVNNEANTASVLLGQGGPPPLSSAQPLAGSSLTLYPNPTATGHLTLELNGYPRPAELTIFNALGQVVLTANTPGSPGKTALALDLQPLAPGLYTLLVKTAGGFDTRRISRQ